MNDEAAVFNAVLMTQPAVVEKQDSGTLLLGKAYFPLQWKVKHKLTKSYSTLRRATKLCTRSNYRMQLHFGYVLY